MYLFMLIWPVIKLALIVLLVLITLYYLRR
jgi:hypothetical protein